MIEKKGAVSGRYVSLGKPYKTLGGGGEEKQGVIA